MSSIEAYIMMNIKSGAEDEVCEALAHNPIVEEVSVIYGEYDAILKVKSENMRTLDQFITETLRALPNIFLTATMLIAKQYK
ncbi:Lrp/AsnC ligand binding domain-containing protein [Candidatus Bathyarchaeota archaeon]|nr:Lrp/AsnC ligand binding domain-containing protein [Candidatus Bathyarchaeota archaeon]MBT4320036.1 Lrp/AsnC ligand binding domain-containing protein [Candidatus Bathyarchaeota archaeon]MBT4423871.1 Lrp/AsnC ligand binding domain-containing protein [Candidatus Bathyarchaeota archaeon]MBT5641962.1 Lrp/AsnC ligand binding domain-containing protein [Candidatus Bathyarchaeota archaeon]MBT6604537.1 Lrp/AsnC ligand binding domain-containing protein [Candidatus Bathyarchaeota archaeon]